MTSAAKEPVAPGWPQTGQEIPARDFGPFDREALARYAAASGDVNPLHLDPDVARAAGLPDTPVHGMLLLSCFEPFILGWRSDLFIEWLSGKFLRPVFANGIIRVSGRVIRRRDIPRLELILRLIARTAGDDLAIVAESTVFYRGGGRPG
ncbi:MAG: MaoC family dehydratase [Beijerinckiaceae bacterium]|nr:MaoC family dehydratase [Beijerinckiaceae bacterium]MCI0736393.1 MaoC family dehydratase [Beijerinckiaceae bacterium]